MFGAIAIPALMAVYLAVTLESRERIRAQIDRMSAAEDTARRTAYYSRIRHGLLRPPYYGA